MSDDRTWGREVSRDEFYAFMGPKNVHPRPRPDFTEWVVQGSHDIIGRSYPGYLSEGAHAYYLR
jgi:hypothetical protein